MTDLEIVELALRRIRDGIVYQFPCVYEEESKEIDQAIARVLGLLADELCTFIKGRIDVS